MFSEGRLKLIPKWFTGAEWADGTAERELKLEYKQAQSREQAIENAKSSRQKRQERAERAKRKFDNYMAYLKDLQ
jgi:hypothetical protein